MSNVRPDPKLSRSSTGITTGYQVLESTNGGAYSDIMGGVTTGISTSRTHNVNGATYSYCVYAYNGPAKSDTCGRTSIAVWLPSGGPGTPHVPTQSNSSGAYTISWASGGTYAVRYEYQESTEYDRERDQYIWGIAHGVGNVLSYTFTGKTNNTTYYYRVRACNQVEITCSGWFQGSNGVKVVKAPATPSLVWVSPDYAGPGDVYTVYWNASSGTQHYDTRHRRDSGSYTSASNVGTATSSRQTVGGGYTTGETISWEVRACNGTACSAWAGPATLHIKEAATGSDGCIPWHVGCPQPKIVEPAPLDTTPPSDTTTTPPDGDSGAGVGSGLTFDAAVIYRPIVFCLLRGHAGRCRQNGKILRIEFAGALYHVTARVTAQAATRSASTSASATRP